MPRITKTKSLNLKKYLWLGLLLLFIISRIFFINAKEVFFDSKEYLNLFANPSLYKAIILGHHPVHEGYILLFWPVYQLAKMLSFDPGYTVVLGQIILAILTVYFYYKIILFISDKKVALLSAIIISLTPLFWITNVTITLEISYLSFYFLSLYLLTLFISKNKLLYLFLSFLCYSFAFVTYSAVLLWLPIYFIIVFYKKRELFLRFFFGLGFFLFFTLVTRLFIISAIFNTTPLSALQNFYLGNATDAGGVPNNLVGLLIRVRNFIPLLRGYTSVVFILSLVGLIVSYFKNKKIFFIGILWIAPVLYTNQWWDTLFIGRYSIIAGFGFSLLCGYFINRYRFLIPILFIYLLIVTVPTMWLLRANPPYVNVEQFAKTLPRNSLLIESHFEQPVLEHCCTMKVLGVNRPDIGNEKIQVAINSYLQDKKPVFVTSAATSDPYGLYTGPYLHPLSLSYTNKFQLNPLLTHYKWKIYKIINKQDNLIIYQITSKGKSKYPAVVNMQRSYRRLDYYDPVTRLWWLIQDSFRSGEKK